MQAQIREKLSQVIDLVNNVLVNPDISLDYSIPEESTEDPYVLLKYTMNESHVQEQKIPIKKNYLKKTPEDLANLITFFIEQFTEQIESLENGAQ